MGEGGAVSRSRDGESARFSISTRRRAGSREVSRIDIIKQGRRGTRSRALRVLVGRETLENPGYVKHRKTLLQERAASRRAAPGGTLGGTRN